MRVCSDVEFGKLQSKDLLQHLWTGPISNASVDVVQGARSVEVRAVGVTKVSLLGDNIQSFSLLKKVEPRFLFRVLQLIESWGK